jgi:abortive infection bacteriophage resistance protein
MEDYKKAPLTHEQHIELLKSRGLIIDQPKEALKFLKQVNYYRFTGYCIPFQKPHDVFIPETTFEKIEGLYRLDEELRDVVFAMLTPFEIYLRNQVAYVLSHKWGAFAHYETSMFQNAAAQKLWLEELEKTTQESREAFLIHFKNKYNGFPRLPLWMACEIMSLGSLSAFYSQLTTETRYMICSPVGVDHNVFRSWLHTLTFLRNICAHHSRLWSRNFSISPMILDKNPEWQAMKFNNKKLFTTVAIMEWICRKAELPLCNMEPIYITIEKIAAVDARFAGWMGVPAGRKIGMCWESVR